jgi:long-chain acyl-CoA synthetase
VIDRWSIVGMLRDLAARGQHSGVIAFAEEGVASWDSATVADKALRLAHGLQDAEVGRGSRVAIWAPNSPVWVVAALAVLAAGGVVVPIDDLADAEQFEAALSSAGVQLIFTTAHHLEASGDILRGHAARVVLVDEPERAGQSATGWLSVLGERTDDLPVPGLDQPALLSWTSGTTGSPKAFLLTHRNIATNVGALLELAVVGPQDRALLPLPLHHAYPFIVGMLTTLTIGTAIVLPGGTTGPLLMRAMREREVTTIIGVPRLYDALWTAIETHASRPAARRSGSSGARCSNRRVWFSGLPGWVWDGCCSPLFDAALSPACGCWSRVERGSSRKPRSGSKPSAGPSCRVTG